ncbi:MAG: YlxR family protein [Solirubrobacteraceae bacterium]
MGVHVSRRRCVGCGRSAPKSELVRIALDPAAGEGRARNTVLDRDARMPGRGAYLCRDRGSDSPTQPAADCLEPALKRGGIARALRCAVTLPAELVESVGR